MGIATPGVGSNLDVNAIIDSLMAFEARPLTLLDQKEAAFQAELSGYGSLKSAISSFETAVSGLNTVAKYINLTASSSDTDDMTATATSTAIPGSYSVETTALAANQKLIATGQASDTSSIGTGILTFDFGTISGGSFDSGTGLYTGSTFSSNGAGAKTVTIDSTNDTLSGIRDAINAADIGVIATIVNDGNASIPYRLSLTSKNIGLKNSIKISVSGDAALDTLLGHDPSATQNLSETVTGADSAFLVDGVSITKSSNTITDVIQGVTLNLLKTNSGAAETLSIARDTSTVTGSVGSFVSSYNAVKSALDDLTILDLDANIVGLLQGDPTTISIETRINRILTSTVTALSGSLTSLSDVGISFKVDGTLALDSTVLQSAIDSYYDDIAGVFVAQGKPTDSLINYVTNSTETNAGSYAVNVTTLATKGNEVGSAAAGLTITGSSNDTIDITVDGASGTITLSAGTYTASTLATEVQSKINGLSTFSDAGISVTVTESSGVLTLTSVGYGTGSKVDITGGNGETNLVGASATATIGLNVAGTINGAATTGFGQFLTVNTGNDAAGLKIEVTGGATGSRGTIAYSEGYAFQLEELADDILGEDGALDARTDGINASIDDIGEQRLVINKRLVNIEARYRKQYTSLDILLSQFQAQSDFLGQTLAALSTLPKTGGQR